MTMQDALPFATRAWMRRDDVKHDRKSGKRRGQNQVTTWRHTVLIFDTETTTDPTQRLTFGCYRLCDWNPDGSLAVREKGVFYDDDLPEHDPGGYAMLCDFAAQHDPETTGFHRTRRLALRTRRDFLDGVMWPAIQADALIVGFNLPFDLSRLACDVSPARAKRFRGGFSFSLWEYRDEQSGAWKPNKYRPRLCIKQIDNKRSIIGVTRAKKNEGQRQKQSRLFMPGFLDLRTLAFALTDRGYSLLSACDAFGVQQGKSDPGRHGHITADYIAYARQDVKATGLLLVALRAEFDRHPIDLDPCRAMSPASIAKAYYRATGITPRLDTQPDFPPEILGYAMSAYYGGRCECAIRRTPVPVVYTDVLSMYPTVNANMELLRFHTADRIEIEDCTDDASELLSAVTIETIRDPETWRDLTFFVQIIPDGDIVPVRAQYSANGGTWNIGVNPFHDEQPHWYAGPDLVASVLLTGRVPVIQQAVRLVTAYESNPKRWTLRNWFDIHGGGKHRITTNSLDTSNAISVRDLGTVASTYPYHPEPKRCGPDGQPCTKQTEGVLSRRPVHAAGLVCIGKEAHRLEERDLITDPDEIQSVFADPRREPWTTAVLPRLRVLAAQPEGRTAMMNASGLQSRALRDVLAGRSRPRQTARIALAALVQDADAPPERRCAGCGEPLTTSNPQQRYCSRACQQHAYRARHHPTSTPAPRPLPPGSNQHHAAGRSPVDS